MKLNKLNSITIYPKAPFNFDATFHKPDHFPSQDNDWQPGIKWQTMVWQKKRLGIKIVNSARRGQPKIVVQIYSSQKLNRKYLKSLKKELIYRYSLDLNLKEFNQLFTRDHRFGPIIKKWRGMRSMHYSSLYEHLIIMIVLQNCTVKRSINMLQSLFENYGTALKFDKIQLWSYWLPEDLNDISEEELRGLKIGYRAKFIKRISQQFANGEIDEFELRKLPRED